MPTIAGAVAVLALGAGGGFFFYHRSAAAQPKAEEKPVSPVKSVMHLENFVVNLQGTSGNGYLRIGIDLGLAEAPKEGEGASPATGKLRDAILTVLGTRTADELMTSDGKAKLKADIMASINDRIPELGCKEVYFTEFLVQQ